MRASRWARFCEHVTDPLELRDEMERALALAASGSAEYVGMLREDPVLSHEAEDVAGSAAGDLPEDGDGALVAVAELLELANRGATRSSGPRFFHFVMGGTTPASLAADWLTSALDQVAYSWASSPLASAMERLSIEWLRQLFELPEGHGGVLTTGATMANFAGLAAARTWWAEQQGADVDEQGLSGLPAPAVLTSGYVHPSAVQAIGMLGMGRSNVRRLERDGVGRLDLERLERELAELDGAPAIVIANAGEVNGGDFDPIAATADLADRHGAWLHVDGAFGLFARLAPESRHLTEGVERAHSVAADGHKWLNVPYDCGFAFVREPDRLASAFAVGAPYLAYREDRPNPGFLSPENSRRARAFAVWATLRAYGRSGYRAMVERHLALARHLAARIDDAAELERLADVRLNIVCFRIRPAGVDEEELDGLNRRLGEALLRYGEVFAGTTVYDGKVAFRPAIVNWQTTERDVDTLIDVLLELVRAETS
jgi:glutamate/tyrosine decarboxylase-like PLP-dependent enzyme